MGLSSFFNPDILIGMGRAREAERQNLLTAETERRNKATSLLTKIFDSEDSLPETREEALRQISGASMADPSKPFKFDFDKIISVRPQVGKSVPRTSTIDLPDVGPNQFGLSPKDYSISVPKEWIGSQVFNEKGHIVSGPSIDEVKKWADAPDRYITLNTSTFNAPEAPADYRRSGFYSPDEQQSRQLDTYRQQRRIMTDEDIRSERAKQQAEYEFNNLNPPKPAASKGYSSSSLGIYSQDTGDIIHPAPADTGGTPKSLASEEVVLKNGKREMALFNPDPANPGWYKKDPVTGKLIDITDQVAGQYRPPQQPSATIQNFNATQAASGMPVDVNDALNRATMNMQPQRRMQVFATVNQMFTRGDIAQTREVIRQAALESESPAVRQNVQGRREAIKALNDIQSTLSTLPQNLVVGTIEDIARKLGTTKDPKYVEVATRLQALNQAYRKAVTGAQFSQQESAEYVKLFPNLYNTAPVNTQLIASLKDAMNANDSVYWDYKLGRGWSDTLNPILPPNGEVQRVLPDGSIGTFRLNPDGSATRIR